MIINFDWYEPWLTLVKFIDYRQRISPIDKGIDNNVIVIKSPLSQDNASRGYFAMNISSKPYLENS